MTIRCGHCKVEKDASEFAPSQRVNGKWCRACFRHNYREQRPALPPRPCEECGKTIQEPKPKSRFCSTYCKNQARIKRDRAAWLAKMEQRQCENCGAPLSGKRSNARWCSEKCAAQHPNRPPTRRRALLKRYGIDPDQYARMVGYQDDRCGLCGTSDKGAKGIWNVDHDHLTGATRMLLCSPCNTGIGNLKDDPALLRAAARYIESHRRSVTVSQEE